MSYSIPLFAQAEGAFRIICEDKPLAHPQIRILQFALAPRRCK